MPGGGGGPDRSDLAALEHRLRELLLALQKARLAEYLELLQRPGRLVYLNLLAGLARGFGMAIGFTILGAVVIWFLRSSFLVNMPVIGSWIAQLVRIVEMELRAPH
ncbi:MAG: DUF5665 domain-containing protein [Bacillota bacterium]|jgi:MFS family permease|nr:DUF5665 domain-containing protein [Bacillota bacterium]